MTSRHLTTALRIAAIGIALVAAIDPSRSRTRPVRPEVALVSASRIPDPALADRVTAALGDRFHVIRDPPFGAAAVVSIGDAMPPAAHRTTPVAFAVAPAARAPFISITALDVPARGTAHAQIPLRVVLRALAAADREVVVGLRVNDLEIDRKTFRPALVDHQSTVELTLPSGVAGPQRFTITAAVEDSRHFVDGVVAIRESAWQILSVDRRPSWAAGFVRRALEGDARFQVVSRVGTSRGISSSVGNAPASLSGADLDQYDAIIVGGLEALTPPDLSSLESYMRDRGGSVVLLPDEPEPPAALRQLTGIARWNALATDDPSGEPLAAEALAPASPAPWMEVRSDRTVRMPVGAGELIVAGAMDAWRYRQRDATAFDRHWQLLAGEAAERGQSRRAASAATGESDRQPVPDERAFVAAWAGAHQGRVVAESELAVLGDELSRVLAPPSETRTEFPMRSAWWVGPFGLVLGLEWWTRRRRGEK